MNAPRTDHSHIINHLGDLSFGLKVLPFRWGLMAVWNSSERYAFVACGPFELFMDW